MKIDVSDAQSFVSNVSDNLSDSLMCASPGIAIHLIECKEKNEVRVFSLVVVVVVGKSVGMKNQRDK